MDRFDFSPLFRSTIGFDRLARLVDAATHVDSIVPRDVELTRFRAGLAEPVGLTGGETSRDALVRHFMTALERRDTVALNGLPKAS